MTVAIASPAFPHRADIGRTSVSTITATAAAVFGVVLAVAVVGGHRPGAGVPAPRRAAAPPPPPPGGRPGGPGAGRVGGGAAAPERPPPLPPGRPGGGG